MIVGPIEIAQRVKFQCGIAPPPQGHGGFRTPLTGIKKPRSILLTLLLPDGKEREFDLGDRIRLMAKTTSLAFWERLIETCPEAFEVEQMVPSGTYRITPLFLQAWVDTAKKPESPPGVQAPVNDDVVS